ncbi:venom acid phosphatase Acph-1-like [Sitophilus oryzae]|uniref:acid phosphatase n=1 Tax=Sitophilus oryzae TaxID=7048 RepID=A0A6J2XZN3_SITOR|nr:venom acid phosphatase Acph-1-like [Sitophilus oryzae]
MFGLSVITVLLGLCTIFAASGQSTLELVHVLFRHGNRNPEESSLYESDPFYNESFYREGYGQLTNEGKRTEYQLGTLLRRRYNNFLGQEWNINYLDVRTSDYNRTKMSALLVVAALYPPRRRDVWSPYLDWQPIPYNYKPSSSDKELLAFSACSNFYTEVYSLIETEPYYSYIQERYGEAFKIIEENTGLSSVNIFTAAGLQNGMVVQQEIGYPLEEWTKSVYPEPLNSALVDAYYLYTNTTALRKTATGYLLKKILADTESKINGTISPSSRKVFVYSAHDMNVGSFLLSLELYKLVENPPYGSHILIELHKIRGVYGIRLFYQNYEQRNPIPLKLANCGYFCPYDEFYEQVSHLIPDDDDCVSSESSTAAAFAIPFGW